MMKTPEPKSWIEAQALQGAQQWDDSLTTFYPETAKWMSDPQAYLERLTKECNYLNAAKKIDWDGLLVNQSTVVDLGCGGGWLTAFLSRNEKVARIIAIDSSSNYLKNFLPGVIALSAGDPLKVEAIQGMFTPLLLPSDCVDTVVMSSAIHHADSPQAVLEEILRVLKPSGSLVLLNECPVGNLRFLARSAKAHARIFLTTLQRKYTRHTQRLSTGAFLYDPYLGDVDYPMWYWEKAIASAGLTLKQIIDTGMPTVVGSQGRSLQHFICRKPG